MTNRQKLFTIMIITATITCLAIGSTFAYWTWSTSSAQATSVTFTVASGFTCSADGGGNITSSNIQLVPADCTNSAYAIKRTVKVSTVQDSGKVIYLDMKLKVDSISANLSASQNFKYALTTSSTSCESGIMAEGTFNGTVANDELPLLTKEQYLSSTSNDTFYLWVWLDKKETNSNTMNQTFKLSLTGSCTDQEPVKTYAPWGAEVDMYKRIDFSQISSSTNGQGLYVFKPTVNDTNPIYYYRGAVTDNNVLFGGFCWKIVRTTETGGTKLIYNGVPVSGECTATTGTDTQISTSKFNNYNSSPAYVGYMYGTAYDYSKQESRYLTTSYKFGNSFTYNGGSYTLVDTIDTTGNWANDYNTLGNNHYTCFNTTGTCTSLYFVIYADSSKAYYITLNNGKSIEQVRDEMLTSSSNTISSTIKTVLDTWYTANLAANEINLEDTVWCYDRDIYQLNGWDPDGGVTNKYFYFVSFKKANIMNYPGLRCNPNDAFTKTSSSGNGKLTNPVGLITVDEATLAGGSSRVNNSFYLYTNQGFWTGSPSDLGSVGAYVYSFSPGGGLIRPGVSSAYGVRPSVSLKPGGVWSGSGTSSDPYTVSYS